MIEISVSDKKWYDFVKNPKILIKKTIKYAVSELKVDKYNPTISVVLSNDKLLRKLNLKYHHKDYPTNVLSFAYDKLFYNCFLGEIILSLETICKEACDCQITVLDHVLHITIHGFLHILGYDHQTAAEESIMQALEVELLAKLGVNNPYQV